MIVSGVRKGMSKKESQEQQQVLHFRLRVLDLVEVYISSETSLRLTLGLTGPLLGLLERCIKDQHLRPLEGRLRHILALFGGLKRFKNVTDVSEEDLAESLSSILVHGQRTQAVFLAVAAEAAALAAFLARAAQQIEGSGALGKVFTSAAHDFLSKRECVLPAAFFVPLLKTSWPGNLQLWKLFAEAAFDEDDKVRYYFFLRMVPCENGGLLYNFCFPKNQAFHDYSKTEKALKSLNIVFSNNY
jgi:hypothetical protein